MWCDIVWLCGNPIFKSLMRTVFVVKVAVHRDGSAQIFRAEQHEMVQAFLLRA